MSLVKYRLKEVAADFGVAPKVIADIISKYFQKPKSNTQVLTDEELNLVFDSMTQTHQIASLEQVFAVKPAPKAKGKVPVTVALIESEQGLLLQRRPARGLLAGLWQPAAWEKALTRDELTAALAGIGVQAVLDEPLPPAKHVFTHKIWELGGWKGTAPACALPEGYVWAAPEDLAEVYPVPNAFGAYVKAK
jgi:adenine-specific DNA glycosylase